MNFLNRMHNEFSGISLLIKFCYFTRYGANWSETKTKKAYTLWNICEGDLRIEIGGKTFAVSPGDSILFYPGDKYRAQAGENGCAFQFFAFSLEVGNRLDVLFEENLAGIYRSEERRRKCRAFCDEYLEKYYNKSMTSLRFYTFCLDYLVDLLETPGCCRHFHGKARSPQDLPINRILDHMNEHYAENLQIKDLAAVANMSEKYFIRYFQKYIRTSPKQYLIDCRMRHALSLLDNPDESIAGIAEKLGYSDQYSFSKAFRKYYGESPSAFRKYFRGK